MAQLLRVYDDDTGRRYETISLEELERALAEGAEVAIGYETPAGKKGTVQWNRDIETVSREQAAPQLEYSWERARDDHQ
jgi:hypothetical protein